MNVSRLQVSLGSLALVLCLALPMGILSLFTPATTGDQVDAAETVLVARVGSMQYVSNSDLTIVEFEVRQHIAGERQPGILSLALNGRPNVEVGDEIVAMLELDPPALLGTYQLRKDPITLEYDVITPVTGMYGQAVVDTPPVPLRVLTTAIRVRLGRGGPVRDDALVVESSEGEEGGLAPDAYEPNNTLDTRTEVFLDPPKLVTGNPTMLTGLTITSGDIDFFSFDGSGTAIIHAETQLPEGATSFDLDTFMGLFDVATADLITFDDDGAPGKMSRIIAPLEKTGTFSVAVESAPDPDLLFTGATGTTIGEYELSLELEQGSYVTNSNDIIMGVSPDGTFIEDFIGFKRVFGDDVLLVGVPADGWGMSYDVFLPTGMTTIYGGAGDQLTDPGFTHELLPTDFMIGPFVDSNGVNPDGAATSSSLLPHQLRPRRGMLATLDYTVGLNQSLVDSDVRIQVNTLARVENIVFTRVMDVNLFGPGADTFYWLFDPQADLRVFPATVLENVGNLVQPGDATGSLTDDLQIAIYVDRGNANAAVVHETIVYPLAFNYLTDFFSEIDVVQAVVQNLTAVGMTGYCIAVDVDPDTGLYAAFGVGVGTSFED